MDPIENYPERFDQQYKHYEFLPCVLYSTQFEGEHEKKYKMGRFKGIDSKRTNAGTLLLNLYKTHPDSFDIIKTHFWFKETDPYPKYQTQQFVMNLFRGRLLINKYPMYLKHLYLLYIQKANTDNPLSSDCLYSISVYLKPNTIFDYEIIWDNW